MEHVLGLRCTICGAEYGVDDVAYVCPRHGNDGILDVVYDYDLVRRRFAAQPPAVPSMWRYLPLLPVSRQAAQPLVQATVLETVGWTPLYPAPRIAAQLGLQALWVKDDSRQPTASLKDRASAVAVVKAREQGAAVVTTASTGNAGAALAGLCAAVEQRNVILVPRTAPPAKVAQLVAFGSTVLLVDGSYDQAFDLCLQVAQSWGWYNRNTAYNPYMAEGKKTAAYEICEQLGGAGRFRAPDVIVVPVGDGCIIGGVHKGLRDLAALGQIDRIPRLVGVQAAGSASLVDAWERGIAGWEMEAIDAHTVADSICAGLPRDRNKALRAVRETGGAMLRVDDAEILAAIPALARGCGVFAEPAAAAVYAGLVHAVEKGIVSAHDEAVLLITGSGLKDVASVMKGQSRTPAVVEPTLAAVEKALDGSVAR
ncbi:MAG: threonine synthase [Anaerolineae bacterium]|nr:threonine synthase [Anaerolineae bacterium]